MSFGSFDRKNDKVMSEINTTPLVDVMLVLLIIFMVTAPLITNSVSVDLPKNKSISNSSKENYITISINKDNEIFWNNKKIKKDDLSNYFTQATNRNSESEIRLEIDKEARYNEISEVIFEAKKNHINKLSFVSSIKN